MTRVYIIPAVVSPGGQVTICVDTYAGSLDRKNVQIGFSRVELRRDVDSFSVGVFANTAKNFKLTVTVPERLQPGPHLLTDFRLIPEEDVKGNLRIGDHVNLLAGEHQLEDLSVFVGDKPASETADQIRNLHAQRLERIQHRIEIEAGPDLQNPLCFM